MPPLLSIVIPSHCRPDLLASCLRSVLAHAPPGTEILVVDDGSPRKIVGETARSFAGVETIRLPRQRGFCAAANAGVLHARGTIVELLNDDTEVTANWAAAAVAAFADPAVAAVAPLVLCQPEPAADVLRIDSAGDRYYLGGIAGKRGHGQPFGEVFQGRCPVFGASASSGFFRREAWLRVGGLPESFGAYFEDVDLAFRLHRAGYKILFEPDARVFHRVSASYGKRPGRQLLEQQAQNEERVFWRNLPAGTLPAALPRHLAVLAAKAWRRWLAGGLAPFLAGRLRILSEVPDLVRHRQALKNLGPATAPADWQVESRWWG